MGHESPKKEVEAQQASRPTRVVGGGSKEKGS